jgi:pyruvate dehydrogenase E2 component (dihydrolipoamide acetyltransferase)/2-oxoisovalerate dehydrogenase E2 component (dihydrolipoyl transacylase)
MDFRLPELGEGVYEAEMVRWHVAVGDVVKRGQTLLEVMTDKATMEVPSPFAGKIVSLEVGPEQQLKVGQVILRYEEAGKPTVARSEPAASPTPPPAAMTTVQVNGPAVAAPPRAALAVKAAPSVRQLARKLGIDLGRIPGSGPEGRILLDDLARSLRATTAGSFSTPTAPSQEPQPDYGIPGTRVKLVGLRRKIAEHMVHSKRTAPHYSYVEECDATELVRLRESLKEPFAKAGVKLTILSFIVKASALALKDVPLVNASLDDDAGEIVLHDRYDIGVAVATPGGLVVPVVRDADKKDIAQIARDIERLSGDVRAGKAKREDLVRSTFTVTSIGGIGGLISTPVLNHPEVGILGIGKLVKRPVYDAAGNLRPADLLYLSFSFDHRVLDGAVGAAFGNAVLRRLLAPATLLLPEKL